ncbi:hypothetical protein MIMGU_mgv1a022338mg [Erythranthe guttata]|uniref:Rx N-terminal domain-containing protein n=1 Tax=Erythranthe guttata TaxID=4155 RepID=A0A022RFJ9_ERYGU|nr:hypothetical protein MIMGU_mgv1a022338mg [Erythranthe guttata]
MVAEVVAEAALRAAIQVILQNLTSVSVEQINLVQDFNEDLKRLRGSVSMIWSFLNDAEKKQVNDESVKQWLKKLESVAYDADNVLDELHYHHKKIQTQHKVEKMVRGFFPYSIRHPNTTRRIKDINKKLEEINHEAINYGLQKAVVGAYAPIDGLGPSASTETDSFTIDPIFLAREKNVFEIVNMITDLPNDQVFSILPIVGMGGLGKSSLAKKVFDHETVKNHFAKRFWVHVSENFNVVILLKKILTSLTETNVELGNKQALLEKFQKDLGAERFLLVLDDVWNDSQERWDEFIIPLTRISSASGNGIIVTTRSEIVASMVTTLPIHKLNTLSEDDCWSIIKAKAIGEGHIPSEFETIGVSIAKRCQGLPMAAKVVGGLLRGKPIDEWLSIEKNWLSDLGDRNSISKILKLSFDHLLSPSLKKCFAYCSIYPKGYDLQRERLVELWMAEGFLGGNDDMENVGNKLFNLLLENSLLQVVKANCYGDITYYNMHGLVHDLASSILNSSDQVRYIGLQSIDGESCILKEQASCVRSLMFNEKICALMFSEFKSLHVLILMGHCVEELPSSIRDLIHLRCLDISGIKYLRCLPDSIGELYHLQTLRACYALEKLPNTMKHLISLRHLHIPAWIELPPEMGRLTSLRTLPYFGVGDEKGCGIGELGTLKNLQGELEIYNLDKVYDKEEAKRAELLQKSNIVKLKLAWREVDNREGENGDESVLEGLQPHPNLKSLQIYGFGGRSLALWCSNMVGLNNLMEIRLENCTKCEQVPTLGPLPRLKTLHLINLENVKSIDSLFYGIDNCRRCNNTITVFPALERLELVGMSKLSEWLEAELMPYATENQQLSQLLLVVFPSLKYLEVNGCGELMSAPSHFPCLQELGISRVHSGVPLANICGVNLTSLAKLRIVSIDGLVCLPDSLFHNNQKLSSLMIWRCPNLTHLVRRFQNGGASAMRELEIWDCSKLTELPDNLHSLIALERLSIHRCPNLETIPYPHESRNQQLLGFKNFVEIEELPDWVIGNNNNNYNNLSSSLQKLRISNFKKLCRLPSKQAMLRLTKLTDLKIDKCPMLNLNERRGADDDSEWPKISHIPNVIVDDEVVIPTNTH